MQDIINKILIKEIYSPIIYVISGVIIYKLLVKLIDKVVSKRQKVYSKNSYNYKKIETFKGITKNIIKIIMILLIILSIMPIYGINVSSILAGLGIASAAVALALQDVLKDIFGGLSLIMDDLFAIGDIVKIGDFKGEVISIGLKSTRIKNYEGYVKIIPNRNVSDVINYSCSYSLAIVDVSVSYEDDIINVEKVLNQLAEELTNNLTKLKDKVEVLGIENLDSSSVVFRITAKTESMEHLRIQREIKKAVKLRLDKEKIKIPYNQIEVHNGQ